MKGLRALGFPALAAAIGVLSAAVLAAFAGENPFHVLAVLFRSAFGSRFGLGYTLYYMTPLLLTGLAVALPYRAGLFNVGAEGQLLMGALGVGITSQTLRGAILANIKEFASLRALGVSMGSLRLIVVELSFWVGIVGLGATALLTFGISLLAKSAGLPMGFPIGWITGVAILLMLISMASGLMAMGILKKSQPADLLR